MSSIGCQRIRGSTALENDSVFEGNFSYLRVCYLSQIDRFRPNSLEPALNISSPSFLQLHEVVHQLDFLSECSSHAVTELINVMLMMCKSFKKPIAK